MKRVLLLLALGCLSAAAVAESFTGCITPGGTIIHVRSGDVPLKHCAPGHQLIHLTDRAAKQTQSVTYNHEAMCTALSGAGASKLNLDALGCPTGSEATPFGEPKYLFSQDLGPLAIANCTHYPSDYCYQLTGAFIGEQTVIANLGFDDTVSSANECVTKCKDDDRCFLSWVDSASSSPRARPGLVCHLFYRSEKAGLWEHTCGDSPASCQTTGFDENVFWYRDELVAP